MSVLVIDASVALMWFIPETHAVQAKRLLHPEIELVAPDLLFAEIVHVAAKKVRSGQLTSAEAGRLVDDLALLPIVTVPCRDLAADAAALAIATDRSGYDSMYLALAIQMNTRFITADQRFANAIRSRPKLAPFVQF